MNIYVTVRAQERYILPLNDDVFLETCEEAKYGWRGRVKPLLVKSRNVYPTFFEPGKHVRTKSRHQKRRHVGGISE